MNTSDRITGIYGSSSDYQFSPKTRELHVEEIKGRTLKVDANNHATLYRMSYTNPNEGVPIEVTVGSGIAEDSGNSLPSPGSCIIFVQESDVNNITFIEEPGITIVCAGQKKSWGKSSVVTLMSLDEFTWVLGGDFIPNEVIVDG